MLDQVMNTVLGFCWSFFEIRIELFEFTITLGEFMQYSVFAISVMQFAISMLFSGGGDDFF